MILVTGATGMFGSRTVQKLSRAGQRVRALVRSLEKARDLEGPGVELFQGDLDDRASVRAAVAGVERVFVISPMDPALAEREIGVVEEAGRAGVSALVKLHGAVRHEDALGESHTAVLEAIRRSGIPSTLVSPSSVMETTLHSQLFAIKNLSALFGCAGQGRIGLVAADDVASVAAHVLTTTGHGGQNYELTGPEALSFHQMAEALTRVLGKTVVYHDLGEEEFGQMLVRSGAVPADLVDILVLCHFRAFKAGGGDFTTDTFEKLLGRKPTSLEEWLRQHARVFQ